MKVSDFKLLCQLPEEYEYDLFPQFNGDLLIAGKKDKEVICFWLKDNELIHQPLESLI